MDKILYKFDNFEGPLDLLLKLINKKKISINDIKISILLEQYMKQINNMRNSNVEIKSEFLEMSAKLLYIKTVSLIPNNSEAVELKNELSNTLNNYQYYKDIAKQLAELFNNDTFVRKQKLIKIDKMYNKYHNPSELLNAYSNVLLPSSSKISNNDDKISEIVSHKIVSVFSRVIYIFKKLLSSNYCSYNKLFKNNLSKSSAIATFLAILELIKSRRIIVKESNNELSVSLNKEKF